MPYACPQGFVETMSSAGYPELASVLLRITCPCTSHRWAGPLQKIVLWKIPKRPAIACSGYRSGPAFLFTLCGESLNCLSSWPAKNLDRPVRNTLQMKSLHAVQGTRRSRASTARIVSPDFPTALSPTLCSKRKSRLSPAGKSIATGYRHRIRIKRRG